MATPLDRRLEAAPAPLFAPLGLALPLRIEQTGPDEFAADAALASFTLRSAQAVLEADAIAAAFDPAAELDGEPLAGMLALTRRLVDEMGDRTAVLGTLAAPSTLIAHVSGAVEEAARLTAARAVDGLCGAGVAGLVMLEAERGAGPRPVRPIRCRV